MDQVPYKRRGSDFFLLRLTLKKIMWLEVCEQCSQI